MINPVKSFLTHGPPSNAFYFRAKRFFFKIIFDQQVLPVLAHASGKQNLSPR